MWFIPLIISAVLFIVSFFTAKNGCILHFLLFTIAALVTHFTDTLWVTDIYVLLVLFAWFMFYKKKKMLDSTFEFADNKKEYTLYIIANITIPIYQTINWLLLFATYTLNK